jgi:hypothetical protein
MFPSPTIVIRLATLSDHRTLTNLAALDSRHPLAGPAMLAEVDGIVRAALDLSDGSVAADPFVRTAEVIELLRLRARRLRGEKPIGSRRAMLSRVRHPRRALSVRT